MKRFVFVLFCMVALIAAAPTFAQTATPVPPTPGLGVYWLVDDNEWDGVWIRQGETNKFDAYWSLDDEEDISADLTIAVKGTKVTIDRVDPPNKWNVDRCHYIGEFASDGVTVNGSVDCHFTTGETGTTYWSATVIYETPLEITWGSNAIRYRAAKNKQFDFICPPSGSFSNLYGTDIYTDDSSICTAAVHAGVLTPAGGAVRVEIVDGQDVYESSLHNGVTSNSYTKWRSSFRFTDATAIIPQITWNDYAIQYRGKDGEQFTFECLPKSADRSIWGTDVYTDDSPICVAALHSGIITTAGGIVTIEIMPGQSSYEGSERNGISSRNYGYWAGSYRFV